MSLSGIGIGKFFSEDIKNGVNDLDILLLIMSADIVGLKQPSLLLYHIDCLGMILDIEPVTNVLAVSVNGKLCTLKSIVDHKRDELLGELVRAVVVGAVGYIGREMIRIHISPDKHIGACL